MNNLNITKSTPPFHFGKKKGGVFLFPMLRKWSFKLEKVGQANARNWQNKIEIIKKLWQKK